MHSLTWQILPPWLYQPLMDGLMTASQAAELFDLWLMLGEPDSFSPDCPRLQKVAQAIWLQDAQLGPPIH